MPTVEALVPTDRASRYLVQLCQHANHMTRMRHQPRTRQGGSPMPPEVKHVDYSDTDGVVRFAKGQWTLQATADTLTLRVEAADDDTLRRLQDGIAARLEKIGRRDQVTVAWHRPETPPASPGDKAPGADPAETGAGKRWWRGRLGTVGLVTGGALIVALHLGLGGAVLAAAPWVGWTSNILLVIILVKVVVMAGHVILGRFALRRGKAVHGRWKLRQSPPDPTPATGPAAAAEESVTHEEHA